ncbi:unnamed protein product, partial [Heligmosomoides polygyrus]
RNCPLSCSSSIIESADFSVWRDEEPKRALPITKLSDQSNCTYNFRKLASSVLSRQRPIFQATIEKAIRLGVEQYRRLQESEGKRIRAQGVPPSAASQSAVFSHASLMAPKKESLQISRTAGVLREATQILIKGTGLSDDERLPLGLDVSSLQRLLPEVEVEDIVGNFTPFLGISSLMSQICRSYSGWCNNLRFPKYGNAFGPMRRLLDPAYDDGACSKLFTYFILKLKKGIRFLEIYLVVQFTCRGGRGFLVFRFQRRPDTLIPILEGPSPQVYSTDVVEDHLRPAEDWARIPIKQYCSGFDSPRTKALSGGELPSARAVSNAVHNDAPEFHVRFTHMLMQFGQILDHDMMHSPIARGVFLRNIRNVTRSWQPSQKSWLKPLADCLASKRAEALTITPIVTNVGGLCGIKMTLTMPPQLFSTKTPNAFPGPNNTILNCSSCDSAETLSVHCFPIKIGKSDPFFPASHEDGRPRCMPFARSLLGQLNLGYRNQVCIMFYYFIYFILLYIGSFNKEALPQGRQERDCRSVLRAVQKRCFSAGDERNNEHPGLTVIHTILLREHNRIAAQLHRVNNFWTDEQLYQEARRINTAKLQHVIFKEWLPIVLGCEAMSKYDLMPKKTGYYTGS